MMEFKRGCRLLFIGLFCSLFLAPAVALSAADSGDETEDSAGETPRSDSKEESARDQKANALSQAANRAYNDGDYSASEAQFRELIQLVPDRRTAYRNLARSYFWQAKYPEAVAYYDIYLRVSADADDREQIQSERRLATSRAGDRVWSLPSAQAQVLSALESALENGHAYTAGEGGAWGIYNALLRAGYAQPELAGLKRRLARNLLTEFVGLLVPDAGQPTPQLDLDDWRVQQERLDAVLGLSDDPEVIDVVERRSSLTAAATALLTDRFERARALSQQAAEDNPDQPFILWFLARAELENSRPAEALKTLERIKTESASQHPALEDYAEIFRAAVLQRMNNSDEAAEIYLKLITTRDESAQKARGDNSAPGQTLSDDDKP